MLVDGLSTPVAIGGNPGSTTNMGEIATNQWQVNLYTRTFIDDNRDAAESMSMLFELWGHEVICAYDGRAALETAVKYRPDAVFLDIGLPGISGFEVIKRLRARGCKTPILVLTARDQVTDHFLLTSRSDSEFLTVFSRG